MLIAAGSLINRHGPRVVLEVCLAVMSVGTALASEAAHYADLLAPQLALGLAQACAAPRPGWCHKWRHPAAPPKKARPH